MDTDFTNATLPAENQSVDSMSQECPAEPLNRFPVFQTSDSEEFEHVILTQFGATRAEVEGDIGFNARGNLVQLKDIALVHGASNANISIEYPEVNFFRFSTAIAGSGEAVVGSKTTPIDESHSCIISPGYCTKISGKGRHGWLTLRIGATALDQRLISILGYMPKGSLKFEPTVEINRPEVHALRQLIGYFSEQLNSIEGSLPPLAIASLEDALVVTFLYANKHTFGTILERNSPDTSSREVRAVEEYIEANWNKPLRIADLMNLTNVGSRSLFRSFRTARGYSPMAFAKMIRLKHAKEMLSAGNQDTSVTGVAFKCGFGNLGHFAKEYRDAFGELPSVTLARSCR